MYDFQTRGLPASEYGFFGPTEQEATWKKLRGWLDAGEHDRVEVHCNILLHMHRTFVAALEDLERTSEQLHHEDLARDQGYSQPLHGYEETAFQRKKEDVAERLVHHERICQLLKSQYDLFSYALKQYGVNGNLQPWDDLEFVNGDDNNDKHVDHGYRQLGGYCGEEYLELVGSILVDDEGINKYSVLEARLEQGGDSKHTSGQNIIRTLKSNLEKAGLAIPSRDFDGFKRIVLEQFLLRRPSSEGGQDS